MGNTCEVRCEFIGQESPVDVVIRIVHEIDIEGSELDRNDFEEFIYGILIIILRL
jgi:hypothetical protein